jgi:hypothetical protein
LIPGAAVPPAGFPFAGFRRRIDARPGAIAARAGRVPFLRG